MTAILQSASTDGNDANRAVEFELTATCRHERCSNTWELYGFVAGPVVSTPEEIARGWPPEFWGARVPFGASLRGPYPMWARTVSVQADGNLGVGEWGPPLPLSVPEPGLIGLLAGLVMLAALCGYRCDSKKP